VAGLDGEVLKLLLLCLFVQGSRRPSH
jgi:hypothetical protein